jgi:hypothetical protein
MVSEVTQDTRIQTEEAGSTMGMGVGWMKRTEATRCDVGGDENRNFARFELSHNAEERRGEGIRVRVGAEKLAIADDNVLVSFPLLLVTVQRASRPTR